MESRGQFFYKPFTFDRVVRIIIGIITAIILLMIFNRLSGVLLPFLVAWLLAYLMYPMVKFFQVKCRVKNRTLSILLTMIVVLLSLSIMLLIVIPPVISELTNAKDLIGDYASQINASNILPDDVKAIVKSWIETLDMNIIMMSYSDTIYDFIASVMPRLQSFIGSSIDFVFSLFVVFVVLMYLFFILSDYENISVEFKQLIPQKYRGTVEMVINDLEDGMNKYFRGQFLIAFIVGVLIAIGLYIVGLPLGILLGFMMGVLNVIPYMKLVMLPLLVFFSFIGAQGLGIPYWVELLKVFAVVGGVQVFEDMFLVPKIMGGKMGLRPAVILLSLSIWGSLLGVAGMIIALPLTTILLSYYRRYVLNRMDKGTGEKDSAELQTTTKE